MDHWLQTRQIELDWDDSISTHPIGGWVCFLSICWWSVGWSAKFVQPVRICSCDRSAVGPTWRIVQIIDQSASLTQLSSYMKHNLISLFTKSKEVLTIQHSLPFSGFIMHMTTTLLMLFRSVKCNLPTTCYIVKLIFCM